MTHFEITTTTIIQELFANHGIDAVQQDNTLEFTNQNIRLEVRLFVHHADNPAQKSIQMDVVLFYGLLPIIESFSGFGQDDEQMINDAVYHFTVSSFHVLLSAFFTDKFDEQVKKETWQINQQAFTAILGNVISRGNVPDDLGFSWHDEYVHEIKKLPLIQGTHWLRLYYGQSNSQVIAYEALFNNKHCQTIMPLVENFSWKKSDNFYSIRQFLISKGGIDINRIAYLISHYDNQYDAIEPIQALGLTQLDAQKCATFIPEAFGMVFIKALGVQGEFPKTAYANNDDGDTILIDLTQEMLFCQSLELAQQLLDDGYHHQKQFLQLAMMSAAFNLLNTFLADDNNQATQLDFANIQTLFHIGSLTLSTQETPKTQKPKPFWKFW